VTVTIGSVPVLLPALVKLLALNAAVTHVAVVAVMFAVNVIFK
jgi:hypothetical protein